MTVSVQDIYTKYTGNGSTTEWAFTFPINSVSDLYVYVYDPDTDTFTLKSLGDYSVSLDELGGTVTYPLVGSALSADYQIFIVRDLPYTQDLRIVGSFNPTTLEQALDAIVMQLQQLNDKYSRTIRTKLGTTFDEIGSKSALANKYLMFDDDGNPTASAGAVGVSGDFLLFSSMASLRAYNGSPTTPFVVVASYYPLGLTGGGAFTYDSTDVTTLDDGGVVIVDAAGNRYKRNDTTRLDITMFGAKADGADTGLAFTGTDNTSYVQKAINYCGPLGKPVRIPDGKFRFAAVTTLGTAALLLAEQKHIFIGSRGAVFLVDEDLTASYGTTGIDFFRNYTDGETGLDAHESFELHNLEIRARWSHAQAIYDGGDPNVIFYVGTNILKLYSWKRIVVTGCKVTDLRARFSRSIGAESVLVTGNKFERIGAGCVRFERAYHYVVANNSFKWGDDDAIQGTCNGDEGTERVRHSIVVTGNTLEDTEGILFLGAKHIVISNNTLFRCHGTQITVGLYAPGSSDFGDTAGFGGLITNNQITDPFERVNSSDLEKHGVGTMVDGGTDTGCIDVFGMPITTGTTGGVLVEDYDVANARVLAPNDRGTNSIELLWNNEHDLRSLPGGYNYIVANNHIQRTLYRVAGGVAYSSYGFGELFSRWGWYDPTVTDVNWRAHGINIGSEINNVLVTGNTISGMRMAAVNLQVLPSTLSANYNHAFRNISINSNHMIDCLFGVRHSFFDVNPVGAPFYWDINVHDNHIDCDPYFHNSERDGLTGIWKNPSTLGNRAAGVTARNIYGWSIKNNRFRNMYIPIEYNTDVYLHGIIEGNIVECSPTATGYNAANKGIGDVPIGGGGFVHRIVGCDPTDSATYKKTITEPKIADSAAPTTGTWVTGHFVKNLSVTKVGLKQLIGWRRATVGTANVLHTDWFECWVDENAEFTLLKLADETRNSTTTIANDNTLVITAAANTTYVGEFRVVFETVAAADFKFEIDGPATPGFVEITTKITDGNAPTVPTYNQYTAYTGAVAVAGGTGTRGEIVANFIITTGAASGGIRFRWAQNTSDAGNTTVKLGSKVIYRVVQ